VSWNTVFGCNTTTNKSASHQMQSCGMGVRRGQHYDNGSLDSCPSSSTPPSQDNYESARRWLHQRHKPLQKLLSRLRLLLARG
jgi:hypothetical protein